jgi:hypothetical protein
MQNVKIVKDELREMRSFLYDADTTSRARKEKRRRLVKGFFHYNKTTETPLIK